MIFWWATRRRAITRNSAAMLMAALSLSPIIYATALQAQFDSDRKAGVTFGFEAGGMLPSTELETDKWSTNGAVTLRGGIAPKWQWSITGSYAKVSGDDYKTDLYALAPGLVYTPLIAPSYNISLRLDLGAGRFDIDQFPPNLTPGIKANAFTAVVPAGIESAIRLSKNLALVLRGTYNYVLSDELNGAALEKGNDAFFSINAGLVLGNFVADSEPAPRFEAPEVEIPEVGLEIDPGIEEPVAEAAMGPELNFDTIQFATDAVAFSEPALAILHDVVTSLADYPSVHVEIRGYSDNLGTDNLGGSRSVTGRAYHLSVSLRRAEAVRNYLIDQGIAEQRLTINAFGQDYPIAPNLTPAGRKQNRRVEIVQIR